MSSAYRRKLPIEIQTFSDNREGDYYYVDKASSSVPSTSTFWRFLSPSWANAIYAHLGHIAPHDVKNAFRHPVHRFVLPLRGAPKGHHAQHHFIDKLLELQSMFEHFPINSVQVGRGATGKLKLSGRLQGDSGPFMFQADESGHSKLGCQPKRYHPFSRA